MDRREDDFGKSSAADSGVGSSGAADGGGACIAPRLCLAHSVSHCCCTSRLEARHVTGRGRAGHANDASDAVFPKDFLDFIRALNAHAVEYMLVGGYAVGVYGYVRATSDIDFFYRCTSENVHRLMDAMTTFGAPVELIDAQHLAMGDSVTQMGAPPIRIDLLSGISGVTFTEAMIDAIRVEIADETLLVIGLAALRANKQSTKRRKDRDDLRHLPVAPTSNAPQHSRKRRPDQP